MRTAAIALIAGAATAAPTPQGPPLPTNAPITAPLALASALPPFAAELAQMPMITSPQGWQGETGSAAWAALAAARPAGRQFARWRFALGLIAEGKGADALGVLETMRLADADLDLVAPFRLARGAALVLVERGEDAVVALASDELAGNAEACAWRIRALVLAGSEEEALAQINCALPAINARPAVDRSPFVLAAATAAIDTGKPEPALGWLKLFGDQNPAANLLRGRALIASGDQQAGRLRLDRARISGTPQLKADARLGIIEADLAAHTISPAEAIKRLDTLRYTWRGGPVEQRALQLELRLATEVHDLRGQLRAGATLFRYFKLGKEAAPMLASLQATLGSVLAPDSQVPLPEAAGLYWDYRELSPAGAEGDALVLRLANRLEAAGLYARAAELLQYQLVQRMQDVAQGPMSVKVASLHILAGRPDRALQVLRDTEQAGYSDEMRHDRKRVEAIALHKMGKDAAANAALDGLPDAEAIRAEMHWRAKDWNAFATENEGHLPQPKGLGEPAQAAVLRQAVALAMLGREDRLQALRDRYAAAFQGLPSGQAFDALTAAPGTIDSARLGAAMAAIPQASPIGAVGDLLDAAP
ncbi:MAG TPA: hypothetical protein VM662_08620 [Sphingomonas sp.]|nr:hypothetical protein [Sphingomonas sp.]